MNADENGWLAQQKQAIRKEPIDVNTKSIKKEVDKVIKTLKGNKR